MDCDHTLLTPDTPFTGEKSEKYEKYNEKSDGKVEAHC